MDEKWRSKFRKLHEKLEDTTIENTMVNMAFIDYRSDFNQPPSGFNFEQRESVGDVISHYVQEADYLAFLAALSYM